ncbi:MAG: DUF5615 family PIN-like protein [Bacteroidota bacterium]
MANHLETEEYDVELVSRVALRMSDDDILRWALAEKRIIVTTDSDFDQMIWLQRREHCGVLRLENFPWLERMNLFKEVLANHLQVLTEGAIVIAMQCEVRIRRM